MIHQSVAGIFALNQKIVDDAKGRIDRHQRRGLAPVA
jgi:hypothetical protein